METKINKLQTRMCNLQARMYTLKIDMSDHVYSRSYCSLRKQSSAQSSWDCTHLHRPLQPFSGLQAHLMRYLTAAAASERSIQWGISLLFFFYFYQRNMFLWSCLTISFITCKNTLVSASLWLHGLT